ncbi:hypothetical protein HYH03_002693 [Edaphochlamys debaryana]|uniref:Uncharacterized protein n=1 Tax=Edaphochlamys debaryana TaxID=47281 RepID=A0A836C4P1_9CHLO|nr:hypothetical protein HYH03_002693 [Edaphochlamys debaryana]|eukprot:KAG2499108.1 hypothetical protein HYH03_002693 [Edaphochlamys debaryana]
MIVSTWYKYASLVTSGAPSQLASEQFQRSILAETLLRIEHLNLPAIASVICSLGTLSGQLGHMLTDRLGVYMVTLVEARVLQLIKEANGTPLDADSVCRLWQGLDSARCNWTTDFLSRLADRTLLDAAGWDRGHVAQAATRLARLYRRLDLALSNAQAASLAIAITNSSDLWVGSTTDLALAADELLAAAAFGATNSALSRKAAEASGSGSAASAPASRSASVTKAGAGASASGSNAGAGAAPGPAAFYLSKHVVKRLHDAALRMPPYVALRKGRSAVATALLDSVRLGYQPTASEAADWSVLILEQLDAMHGPSARAKLGPSTAAKEFSLAVAALAGCEAFTPSPELRDRVRSEAELLRGYGPSEAKRLQAVVGVWEVPISKDAALKLKQAIATPKPPKQPAAAAAPAQAQQGSIMPRAGSRGGVGGPPQPPPNGRVPQLPRPPPMQHHSYRPVVDHVPAHRAPVGVIGARRVRPLPPPGAVAGRKAPSVPQPSVQEHQQASALKYEKARATIWSGH